MSPVSSVVATAIDGSRASLTWAHGGGASGFRVERRVNAEQYLWKAFAWLPGSARAWLDATLIRDRVYRYRVVALDGAAESGVVESNDVATAPWEPSGVRASRLATGDLEVEWIDAAFAEERFEVEHEWNRDRPGAGRAILTSSVPGDWHERHRRVTYRFTPDLVHETHRFRVRAANVAGVSPWSAWSADLWGLAPHGKPARLRPDGGALDASGAVTLSWEIQPLDGSPQTAYELEWRERGAATWNTTGRVTSTTASRTFAAGTFTNGKVYEWRVRTWGNHADPSAWSDVAPFRASPTPSVDIISPTASAQLASARMTVHWAAITGSGGGTQAAYEVEVVNAGSQVVARTLGHGTDSEWTTPPMMVPGDYTVRVRIQNSYGLWSPVVSRAFSTEYVPPPASTLTVQWVPDEGHIVVAVVTPTTAPQVVSLDVERSFDGTTWETVAQDLPPTGDFVDPVPPIGRTIWYRAVSRSALPSTRVGDPVAVETTCEGSWIWINAGDAWGVRAKIRSNPASADVTRPDVTLHVFDGAEAATALQGTAVLRSGTVAGDLIWTGGSLYGDPSPAEAWRAMIALPGPKRLRDPRGRDLLVHLTELSTSDTPAVTRVAFSWHEVTA